MRERKPKTTTCFQCKTEHPGQHYAGWRMAGKDLVSPDGDRISPHRLAGFLWTERVKNRLRRKT